MQCYRLDPAARLDLANFEEQLSCGVFTPCQSNQSESIGWVPPRKGGGLVYANNGHWLIALMVERRLLPASVVNDEVRERAEALAETQGYAPGRKQLRELKERVVEELMPQAFKKRHTTFAWLDPKNGWFVVDAASRSAADELIEHLRRCLDELPLKPLNTQIAPVSAMADWLAEGEAPAGFTIDRDCELKAVGEEKAAVRYVRHPLSDEVSSEIKGHLGAGKLPTKLALTWDDRVSFVLTDKLEIKRLAFLNLLKEASEMTAEHAEEQFDADFALMTGELSRFLPGLVQALGGEIVEN